MVKSSGSRNEIINYLSRQMNFNVLDFKLIKILNSVIVKFEDLTTLPNINVFLHFICSSHFLDNNMAKRSFFWTPHCPHQLPYNKTSKLLISKLPSEDQKYATLSITSGDF